jgi:hypothetical protein
LVADADGWFVLGVDPAPSKTTVAFDGTAFHAWAPVDVKGCLAGLIAGKRHVLVLWDAPLSMDEGSFYGRQVDRAASALVRNWTERPVPIAERKAIGVAPAAGCPHNLLSMHVLGGPVGQPQLGLELLRDRADLATGGRWFAEVHPAVAMGAWHAKHRELGTMPRYKRRAGVASGLLGRLRNQVPDCGLGPPVGDLELAWEATRAEWNRAATKGGVRLAALGDDALDAWVSWALGQQLLRARAELWRGEGVLAATPCARGSYVMPLMAGIAGSV